MKNNAPPPLSIKEFIALHIVHMPEKLLQGRNINSNIQFNVKGIAYLQKMKEILDPHTIPKQQLL
jgi:hypothetical protein